MFKFSFLRGCLLGVLATVALTYLPMRLGLARQQAPDPEMILILGGGADRERFAAEFAQQHPHLKIWVSTGSAQAAEIFQAAGIDRSRVYLDCRATDTVTNFTTVVPDLKRRGIQHVYVLTSDFHLPRSSAIANVVFGSQGIAYTPVSVPSNRSPESKIRIARDIGRSVIWLLTGRTGARFNGRTTC